MAVEIRLRRVGQSSRLEAPAEHDAQPRELVRPRPVNAYDYSPMTSVFNATRAIVGTTMPVALHENGPIPDPDQLRSTQTRWVWFNPWASPYPQDYTSVAELQKVYSSSYVITRDEMPNLK